LIELTFQVAMRMGLGWVRREEMPDDDALSRRAWEVARKHGR
jgi:hypothetical protein